MRKRIISAALVIVMAASLMTGCVKVVKIGEEGKLTGETTFDASSSVDEVWDQATEEINANATELSEVLETAGSDLTALGDQCNGAKDDSATNYNYPVKVTDATIKSVDKDSYYGTMELTVPNYTGSDVVTVEIGKYKSNAVRDGLSFLHFKDFKNQTEWGQIGKSMQEKVDSDVVQPVYDDLVEGATVDIVGSFTADSADSVDIVPISITVK